MMKRYITPKIQIINNTLESSLLYDGSNVNIDPDKKVSSFDAKEGDFFDEDE